MTNPDKTKHDWSALDAMTAEQKHAAALADPDAQPTPEGKPLNVRRRPLSWRIRKQLGLTQAEFADRYGIPIGTLRDWDQSRNELSAPVIALLKAIAADPEGVALAQRKVEAVARATTDEDALRRIGETARQLSRMLESDVKGKLPRDVAKLRKLIDDKEAESA